MHLHIHKQLHRNLSITRVGDRHENGALELRHATKSNVPKTGDGCLDSCPVNSDSECSHASYNNNSDTDGD